MPPPTPTHIIVVCCHGIWLGGPTDARTEAEWLIADFQRGETDTFVQHVRAGLQCLAEDRGNAALVFSGGPTRKETQLSEAQSYANIAVQNNYWDLFPGPITPDEILIEDRALDSYHNILFSLALFNYRFKRWPQRLTIVSHAFKKPRLVDGHCTAIGFPLDRVSFVGIDPPGIAAAQQQAKHTGKDSALAGVAQAVGEWAADPHGRGEVLAGKRKRRDPWVTWQGVFPREVNIAENGGLVTVGAGYNETLVDDAKRPWV